MRNHVSLAAIGPVVAALSRRYPAAVASSPNQPSFSRPFTEQELFLARNRGNLDHSNRVYWPIQVGALSTGRQRLAFALTAA